MGLVVETTPGYSTVTTRPIPILVDALMVAIAYYFLRSITTNRFVVIAIGVALSLFTSGTLQTIGFGILALGISRLMEKEIQKIESS
jgi:dolichyl-phosphate-mannose--protein O-mannosyl transferase